MIASVRGPVLEIALDHAVIDCAGVGYRVLATPVTLSRLRRGDEATLLTSMIVREDSMTLYGFTEPDARALFALLQTVTGVGPRLAMATLAVLEPDALRRALAVSPVADPDHVARRNDLRERTKQGIVGRLVPTGTGYRGN